MDAAAVSRTEKEDGERGIDEQDIFDGVVLFLAAITVRLCSRGLGADDAPFGPVMGTRGDTGTPVLRKNYFVLSLNLLYVST
jgi:hypothetical protein